MHDLISWQQLTKLGSILHILKMGKLSLRKVKLKVVGCTACGRRSQAYWLKFGAASLFHTGAYQWLPALFMPLKEGSQGTGF